MNYISLSALEFLNLELSRSSSSTSFTEYDLDKELKKASLETYIISSLGIINTSEGTI